MTCNLLNPYLWFLLAAEVKVSTVHLVANGVYVAYPQFEFDLPTSIDDMEKFEQALKAFITMRVSVLFSSPPSLLFLCACVCECDKDVQVCLSVLF